MFNWCLLLFFVDVGGRLMYFGKDLVEFFGYMSCVYFLIFVLYSLDNGIYFEYFCLSLLLLNDVSFFFYIVDIRCKLMRWF